MTDNYKRAAASYLSRHPFDQVFIALHEFDEELVIANGGKYHDVTVPDATAILHRHLDPEVKLRNTSWWMSASKSSLEWIELFKDDATALGFLLPENANDEGQWMDERGMLASARRTPEFMARKVRRS